MKALLLLFLLVAPCTFAGYLGIDYTERGGRVVLTKIDKNSPAEYYGLKVGDIIITNMTPDEFIASIKKAQPGQILPFRVKNSAGVETVHIPLSKGPGAPFLKGIMQAD